MKKRTPILIIALFALLALQFASVPKAHAASDPQNCEALAQGATYSPTNSTPSPFDANPIAYSPTYTWAYGSPALVACQEINPNNPQSGFNTANWDGYGNPFQCIELIDRYEYLRYGDSYRWGDPNYDWNYSAFPSHYNQIYNGDLYTGVPYAGEILIWNYLPHGHVAVIISVNAGSHQITVLEQNNVYNGQYMTAKRIFSYTYNTATQSTHISGSNYLAYTQDSPTTTYRGNMADPAGWLQSTI